MLQKIVREKILVKSIRKKYSKTLQPGVSIITPTNKFQHIDNIFLNYGRLDYKNKELIIILNNNNLDIKDYEAKSRTLKGVKIFKLDDNCTLGECLNFGIGQSKYDYISKMDDDDYYGVNYLTDLMNVFKYTDAQITGKCSRFIYFKENNELGIFLPNFENQFTRTVAGGTILFKKEIFEKVKFKKVTVGEDNFFLDDCLKAGIKMFSSDKYNYVYMRNRNLNDHTWRISQQDLFAEYVKRFLNTPNFIRIVTV
ncbi:glycosyltransferase [Clostridium autoethanogenum]|uniref:Glycosyltransferase n=1 Tax=Clostridium autoethanogenum DSM 10061 TaxID=1341692 RepID=A0ABM5P046_9CLOT|nr:glycosyltransferase [Clostridium autoethanogenum]AGY78215.1 glycosyltransferase [Clostridium autoethanogenum DSM 10061]ALU38347.1 Glycosyl transferase family 2 [Clostridium autoethanogenum DSM 10061]OVY51110.1 Glycosyl transferase family 2 [Clostridium autoethanogenum]